MFDTSQLFYRPIHNHCHSFDYASEFPVAIQELAKGLSDGSIKRKFHIVEGGIEQAPIALPMLFSGGNTGKLYVLHSQLWFVL